MKIAFSHRNVRVNRLNKEKNSEHASSPYVSFRLLYVTDSNHYCFEFTRIKGQ